MASVVAEIEARIRSLSLEDKTELVRALIAELDGPADPDVERVFENLRVRVLRLGQW